MNILLIDSTSCMLDFAMRCEAQGHSVRTFMGPLKNGDRSTVGDGLIEKVADWKPSMQWADLIVLSDNCKYMQQLEGYRNRGFPIFGPNLEVTSWELDRNIGAAVLEEGGIECLPSIPFKRFDEAIAYQAAHRDTRFVCKPCADVDKSLSYVSKSHKDMSFMLSHWKRTIPKPPPFIFQEFCPGIEVAVGGWFGRDGFASHFLENFEFKKLMNDERGPNTGEMGTAMKYVTAEESRLARELLLPLTPKLLRSGYTGYIDVAVMVGTEGERKGCLNPLEFTSRPGWPLFNIQQVLHGDVANWMKDLLEGRDTFTPRKETALGVVLAMPDFPYGNKTPEELSGFPIWGVDESNRYFFHPCEMKLGNGIGENGSAEPMLVSAGNYLAVATGLGRTVEEAKSAAYDVVDQLEIPNSAIYRTDIGCRLEKQLPILQKHGYCDSWEY